MKRPDPQPKPNPITALCASPAQEIAPGASTEGNAQGRPAGCRDDKIQTGLRIPQKKYEELTALASEIGVSLNSLILMLVDLGLTLRTGRVTLHQESE